MFARLAAYVRGIARRRRIDAEVDEELQFHIEQEIDAHVARGVPRAEARRLVLRDLGGLTQTKEAVRGVRTVWVDVFWRDARHASVRFARHRRSLPPPSSSWHSASAQRQRSFPSSMPSSCGDCPSTRATVWLLSGNPA